MIAPFQQIVLGAARRCGLFRLARWCHRDELLVLTYHSVIDIDEAVRHRYPLVYRNAVTAEHFEQQMRFLRRHYRVLDSTALRRVLDGAPLAKRSVVVTFDDGLLNNATVALPILQRYEIPAFFFLPTGFVDAASEGHLRRHWSEALIAHLSVQAAEDALDVPSITECLPALQLERRTPSPQAILRVVDHLKALPRDKRSDRLRRLVDAHGAPPSPDTFPADPDGHSVLATMTWKQARTAADRGVTLGGHTVNHEILARLPDEEAEAEIRGSLQRIDGKTDQPADWFAYPNGRLQDFTPFHQEVLKTTGCLGAFTQISGFNSPATDPLALRRIDVSPDYGPTTFRYVASGTKCWVDRFVRRRSASKL